MSRAAGVSGACFGAALLLALTATTASGVPHAPRVERLSTATDGTQLPVASSGATVSADGRYTAFTSADPTGGYNSRVYVKDLRTGTLTQVPEDLQYTGGAMTSADGRRVAYTNGNRYGKPYVYDRVTGETVQLWPAQPPYGFYELGHAEAISADGRQVAYSIGSRHGLQALYVRDLVTGIDEQIALPADGQIWEAAIGRHGRTVAYAVFARTAQGVTHRVYVKDRDSGETRLLADGPALSAPSLLPLVVDGRRVLYNARSADGTPQPYVHDLRTARTEPIGTPGDTAAAADATGRHVLLSRDGALTLLDSRTGRQRAVTATGTAMPGAITRNGRSVVFSSTADDLVPDDTNGASDVFIDHIH
ncbi:hypothetical protein [Streptomyces cyaneus]|uniref:hypothetical protein n=1 Tax=Streptomyces cyaneus TaxID=1904 RepID=UPI000FF87A51|nr:hypothetical protein [Streptomyces cyaneus]